MPSAEPTVNRRRVLFGAATLALLGATPAACGSPPSPEIDDLVAQLELALSDSQLASAAATTAPPQLARALTAVASERSAHARALEDEITRATGETPTQTQTTEETTPSSAPPPKPPTTKDVIGALRMSAKDAGELAARLSSYRAGLLGSIAAACTAAYTVALSLPEKAP